MPLVKRFVFIVMLAGVAPAMASGDAPDTTPTPDSTQEQLDYYHSQNLVLQAQHDVAVLKQKLKELNEQVPSHPPGTVRRHVVLSITGKGSRLQDLEAQIRLSDGRHLTVKYGSKIPGTDLTVRSLGASGVGLSDGSFINF